HLNRHFARIVGVPPGAYQRERENVGGRNNVQYGAGRAAVASGAWHSDRQHSRTGPPRRRESRTAPSYGTPSGSASP
ncbi:AraC family transcriptional regulator, partial [Streptomyces griseoluteus]